MTMRTPQDDPGSEPRASDGPSDAGMNKETRCNTVALDLDAVRTIAKASRSARGEPEPEPERASPPREAPKTAPTKAEAAKAEPAKAQTAVTAKVIVQAPRAAQASAATSIPSARTKPVANGSSSAPEPVVKTAKEPAAAPPASQRAVLAIACACLALLLLLTWRLVVVPGDPATLQAAHGAVGTLGAAGNGPPTTLAPVASETLPQSTESAPETPTADSSTIPTSGLASGQGGSSGGPSSARPGGTGAAPGPPGASSRPTVSPGATSHTTIPYD